MNYEKEKGMLLYGSRTHNLQFVCNMSTNYASGATNTTKSRLKLDMSRMRNTRVHLTPFLITCPEIDGIEEVWK